MKKTFENLLDEKYPNNENGIYNFQTIKLMKLVREKTIEECANELLDKFEDFYNPIVTGWDKDVTKKLILRKIILKLDKNLIEM